MKVDGNAPTFVGTKPDDSGWHGTFSNIPIRLEIASKLLAGTLASPHTFQDINIKWCLQLADKLIAEHNKTCEGKDEP